MRISRYESLTFSLYSFVQKASADPCGASIGRCWEGGEARSFWRVKAMDEDDVSRWKTLRRDRERKSKEEGKPSSGNPLGRLNFRFLIELTKSNRVSPARRWEVATSVNKLSRKYPISALSFLLPIFLAVMLRLFDFSSPCFSLSRVRARERGKKGRASLR